MPVSWCYRIRNTLRALRPHQSDTATTHHRSLHSFRSLRWRSPIPAGEDEVGDPENEIYEDIGAYRAALTPSLRLC